jgi:hypothetical protein
MYVPLLVKWYCMPDTWEEKKKTDDHDDEKKEKKKQY